MTALFPSPLFSNPFQSRLCLLDCCRCRHSISDLFFVWMAPLPLGCFSVLAACQPPLSKGCECGGRFRPVRFQGGNGRYMPATTITTTVTTTFTSTISNTTTISTTNTTNTTLCNTAVLKLSLGIHYYCFYNYSSPFTFITTAITTTIILFYYYYLYCHSTTSITTATDVVILLHYCF